MPNEAPKKNRSERRRSQSQRRQTIKNREANHEEEAIDTVLEKKGEKPQDSEPQEVKTQTKKVWEKMSAPKRYNQ